MMQDSAAILIRHALFVAVQESVVGPSLPICDVRSSVANGGRAEVLVTFAKRRDCGPFLPFAAMPQHVGCRG
jgi:hypothetical protein